MRILAIGAHLDDIEIASIRLEIRNSGQTFAKR